MRVLVVGHSYVRDLATHGPWQQELTLSTGVRVNPAFSFLDYPGKDFDFFLDHPAWQDRVREIDPEVVIVVLGGNSIVGSLTNIQIKQKAAAFYLLLKAAVRPSCLKLAVQVEPRFVARENRHGVPEAEEFNRRRQVINNFFNKTLKKQGHIDRVIQLGSANYLNHPQYYRDGVHLNNLGLARYKEALLGGLKYALNHRE